MVETLWAALSHQWLKFGFGCICMLQAFCTFGPAMSLALLLLHVPAPVSVPRPQTLAAGFSSAV